MLVTFNKAFLARVNWKGRGRVMKWLKCEAETCICWQLQNSYGQGTEAGKTCPACAMSGNKYCLMYTPHQLLLKETGMESQLISRSDISSESYLQVPYCWHRDFPGKKNVIFISFRWAATELNHHMLSGFRELLGWNPIACFLFPGRMTSPFLPFEPHGTPWTPAWPSEVHQWNCKREKVGLFIWKNT